MHTGTFVWKIGIITVTNAVWVPGGVFFLLLFKFQVLSSHPQFLSFPRSAGASTKHMPKGNQAVSFQTSGDRAPNEPYLPDCNGPSFARPRGRPAPLKPFASLKLVPQIGMKGSEGRTRALVVTDGQVGKKVQAQYSPNFKEKQFGSQGLLPCPPRSLHHQYLPIPRTALSLLPSLGPLV